ncbi:SDR family oxidoreductase [Vulgatibacter sp.]|uniref:SDR family oxidoreductase n=1 Tax=Vulgatibacter sp. TaxID=1971226 RepID=UPI003564E2DB
MKKLDEQTIVITGASSGIGLATARMAAAKGARVVLSSRNEPELRRLVDEIRREGGQAIFVAADVGDEEALRHVADAAIEAFGGIDTWVNNAGVSIYGGTLEVSIDDQRKLFETNFWGVVHGSRIAVGHLRRRGGTLINIGSVASERALPIQGIYSATKHAMKAWTDALRTELEHEGAQVAVVLIEPASIDTPYTEHARNYMDRDPQLPPPLYTPEVVARAILANAQRPHARVTVGGSAPGLTSLGRIAPRLGDKIMGSKAMYEGQRTEHQAGRADALWGPPRSEGEVRGYNHRALHHSTYTWAEMNRGKVALFAAAALGGLLAARTARSARSSRSAPRAGRTAGSYRAAPARERPTAAPADLWRSTWH